MRDSILAIEPDQINIKMFHRAKSLEKALGTRYPDATGLLIIAFDPFCRFRISTVTQGFQLNSAGTVDFFTRLQGLCDGLDEYINIRTERDLLVFLEKVVSSQLDKLSPTQPLPELRADLDLFRSSIAGLSKRYPSFQISQKLSLAEQTLARQVTRQASANVISKLKACYTSKPNFFHTTPAPEADVSPAVTQVIEICKSLGQFDSTVKLVVLADILAFYRGLLDPSQTLPNVQQLVMDICTIKNTLALGPFFSELENKLVLLGGDFDEKTFLNMYKTFYPTHGVDGLRKIGKSKGFDAGKLTRLISNY
jgi:hypothetical protein